MTGRAQRLLAWGLLLALLLAAIAVPVSGLQDARLTLSNEIATLRLQDRLAQRRARDLDALRVQATALADSGSPEDALYWRSDSAGAALLDLQENAAAVLRRAGLVIDSVEGALAPAAEQDAAAPGETRLELGLRASGEIAALQLALYAIETMRPPVAVARLQVDIADAAGPAGPRLALRLELQALHIEPAAGQ